MTDDRPPTTGLRAAILARCDDLERLAKLARYAGDPDDDGQDDGRWDSLGSGVVTDDQMRRVMNPSPIRIPMVRADAIGVHVATWDPAAVLALVGGAREICEVHQPEVDTAMAVFKRREVCSSCRTPDQWRDGQNWGFRRIDHPCPTLGALARMLGIADPTEEG
jgi:hypothetical protein